MDYGLRGKVAIITGASVGIGKGVADALAAEGASVVLAARTKARVDAAVDDIRARGGEAHGVAADVTQIKDVERLVRETVERFGTVHILVNNAGGNGREPNNAKFEDLDDDKWRRVFDINVLSTVRACRLVIPYMQAQTWGRIINISSQSSIQPTANFAHYGAAKAAVNNLSKALSHAYGRDNIRVNVVAPGLIASEGFEGQLMQGARERGLTLEEAKASFLQKVKPNAVGRIGEVEEVGALVAFLCSEQAGFITGSVYRIEGGTIGAVP